MDDDVRRLERRWGATNATPDGVAYYRALAKACPLPCPRCGSRDSLNELARRVVRSRDPGAEELGIHLHRDGRGLGPVGSVAIGHDALATRRYEFVAGACGSLEACARCGTAWNPRAPGAAMELLLLDGVEPPAPPPRSGLGDWIELLPSPENANGAADQAAFPPTEGF